MEGAAARPPLIGIDHRVPHSGRTRSLHGQPQPLESPRDGQNSPSWIALIDHPPSMAGSPRLQLSGNPATCWCSVRRQGIGEYHEGSLQQSVWLLTMLAVAVLHRIQDRVASSRKIVHCVVRCLRPRPSSLVLLSWAPRRQQSRDIAATVASRSTNHSWQSDTCVAPSTARCGIIPCSPGRNRHVGSLVGGVGRQQALGTASG